MFKSNIFKFLRQNPSLDNFWHENSSEIFLSNFKTMCQDFTSKSSVFPKKMDVVIQCVQVGPAKKSNFKSHCNDCNIICSILLIQGVPASFFLFLFSDHYFKALKIFSIVNPKFYCGFVGYCNPSRNCWDTL